MTPKQYLMQYKKILAQVRIIEQELSAVEEEIGLVAPSGDGSVHGSDISNHTERLALRLIGLKDRLYLKRSEAWAKREEIENVISMAERGEWCRLLYDRYVCLMSWDDISLDLNYSVDYCKSRLHSAALQSIARFIREENHERTD